MRNKTLTFILAGGMGTRLHPLTSERSKPAVHFGGKYRIIDFTLANCLHSGLRQVLVLTQYKSHSLNKHLRDGWSIFNPELGEYITALPAQMHYGKHGYQGTADAIYQNLNLLDRFDADYALVLSGDHIYRMDYAAMLRNHKTLGADVTVACMDVDIKEAKQFGVVTSDKENRMINFAEKSEQPIPMPARDDRALASMGVYVFSTALLKEVLQEDAENKLSSHDFGKDILPKLIHTQNIFVHHFGGEGGRVKPDRYWRDIGTIDSYFQANMDLLRPTPPLNLYQKDWPIRTYQPQSPPARTIPGASGTEGIFIHSILAGGVVIAGGTVRHSILFQDITIEDKAIVENAIVFSGVHIGAGARLRNCIIDKKVQVPANERIGFHKATDRARFFLSENGIIVVPKGYIFEK